MILLVWPGLSGLTVSAQTTETPAPTDRPTPAETTTPTPEPDCEDAFEPNDDVGSGPILMSDQPLSDLTLAPLDDVDFLQVWVKANRYYQVDTATVDGVDTRLRLFNEAGDLLAENDDFIVGDPASRMRFQAPPADGWLFVAVDSLVPIAWGCRTYNIAMTDISAPTPTPTPSPEPTAQPEPTTAPEPSATPLPALYDAYEPNYDFTTAADLGVNQVAALNFHPYPPGHPGIDNDFFRLYVKSGQILDIETTELAPGVDTNLIVYREDAATIIGGNDDCETGQFYSCLEWRPDYTGYAYLLVGPVGLTPKGVSAEALAYRLSITDLAGQPTPTPIAPSPTGDFGQPLPWSPAPPLTPTPTLTPTVTSTPEPVLQLRTFSLAPPTPTPVAIAAGGGRVDHLLRRKRQQWA